MIPKVENMPDLYSALSFDFTYVVQTRVQIGLSVMLKLRANWISDNLGMSDFRLSKSNRLSFMCAQFNFGAQVFPHVYLGQPKITSVFNKCFIHSIYDRIIEQSIFLCLWKALTSDQYSQKKSKLFRSLLHQSKLFQFNWKWVSVFVVVDPNCHLVALFSVFGVSFRYVVSLLISLFYSTSLLSVLLFEWLISV